MGTYHRRPIQGPIFLLGINWSKISRSGTGSDHDQQNLENLGQIQTGRSPDLAVHGFLISTINPLRNDSDMSVVDEIGLNRAGPHFIK